jgi:hypothetical protein
MAELSNKALAFYLTMITLGVGKRKQGKQELLRFAYHAYLSRYLFSGKYAKKIPALEALLVTAYDQTR